MKNAIFSEEQLLLKLKQYCAYQERCVAEVQEKLYALQATNQAADKIMSQLIAENYLNEERFAEHFAGGKFRLKQWGRVKIRYALRQKQVSDACCKKAVARIDEKEYLKTLNRLAEKSS